MKEKMLEGKVAIVSGASYGMGYSMAELFASEGASVVMTARGQEKLDAAVQQIRDKGLEVTGVVADNKNLDDVKRVIQTALDVYGDLDIVINNAAHETVGGMPTVAGSIDLTAIAKACGYLSAVCVETPGDLKAALRAARERDALSLIEVRCSIGAREDLGRPTTTALENKENFMEYLTEL